MPASTRSALRPSSPTVHITFCTLMEFLRPQIFSIRYSIRLALFLTWHLFPVAEEGPRRYSLVAMLKGRYPRAKSKRNRCSRPEDHVPLRLISGVPAKPRLDFARAIEIESECRDPALPPAGRWPGGPPRSPRWPLLEPQGRWR